MQTQSTEAWCQVRYPDDLSAEEIERLNAGPVVIGCEWWDEEIAATLDEDQEGYTDYYDSM